MIHHLRLTILADNHVALPDLLAEHGLAILIEADGQRILFDTGQGKVLRANAEALGIRLSGLDAVVLSHGHFDHTGGLACLPEDDGPRTIFLHHAAVQAKYGRRAQPPHRAIGIPEPSRQALERVWQRVVWTQGPAEVVPGIWCTGEIPRMTVEADGAPLFFRDAECTQPDPLSDDQALFIETSDGLVVIMGCAHAGVGNTLDRIGVLTGQAGTLAIIGGFHLGRATRQQLDQCGNAIGRRTPQLLAPCHCTGMAAYAYLQNRFHALVQDVGVGTVLRFGEQP